jgi:hypothetical protein
MLHCLEKPSGNARPPFSPEELISMLEIWAEAVGDAACPLTRRAEANINKHHGQRGVFERSDECGMLNVKYAELHHPSSL